MSPTSERKALVGQITSEAFGVVLHFTLESCCRLSGRAKSGSLFGHLDRSNPFYLQVNIEAVGGNVQSDGDE